MRITPRHYRVYPELALFSTDDERLATLKGFHRSLLRRPLFWLMCLGIGLANAAVGVISRHLSIPGLSTRLPYWLVAMIPPIFVGASLGLVLQYAWRRPLQRALREHLAGRGVPICLHCGYDLRGQTEPRCPECGEAFALRPRRDDGLSPGR